MSNSVLLKTHHAAIFSLGKINKVLCTIDAENVAKLLDHVNLAANPRESKKNKVTSAIVETLTLSPEEMVNRTKGLLISTQKCETLQRGRFKLTFEDDKTDGVLDGGHNILAIGMYLLGSFYECNGKQIPSDISKIKCWKDFSYAWKNHSNKLKNFLKEQKFLIPVEIIYPSQHDYDFAELVFEISDARNNNSPLTTGTKADHRGHYDELKKKIDAEIAGDIAWKDNESGKRIKREDLVSLSLIPIIALQKKGFLHSEVNTINPSVIYNSKSQCIDIFSKIIDAYNGRLPCLVNNALALMKDIPKLYDEIYSYFPRAYNDHSPGFGRITAVDNKKHKTKFYSHDVDYKYPDGFILPFVCSLHELIEIDETTEKVRWGINVFDIVKESSSYEMLVGVIKDNYFDPQKVGKSSAAYSGCEMTMKMIMMRKK